MKTASPIKLRNGDWGAKVKNEKVAPGDTIEIVTKSGKRWTATVSKCVWSGNGVTLVATESSRSKRREGKTCAQCGHPSGRYDECYDCSRCEMCGRNKYTCGHCIGW